MIATAATLGNLLVGWDSSTIAGVRWLVCFLLWHLFYCLFVFIVIVKICI